MIGRWLAIGLALILAGCAGSPSIDDCESTPDIAVVCKFQNPEDMVPLDGGRQLIVSEMSRARDGAGGSISVYDIGTGNRVSVFDGTRQIQIVDGDNWGLASCPQPRDFAPHGIHLSTRHDGRLQLVVINHANVDRIEYFEVVPAGLQTRLQWRGCVAAPDDGWFSDVVGRYGGGFMVAQHSRRSARYSSVLKGLFGTGTGRVRAWNRDTGFVDVPGTRGALPTGLAMSNDETDLYISYLLDGQVRRVSLQDGRVLASAPIPMPDNLSLMPDGRLLVASHGGGITGPLRCNPRARSGTCALGFSIYLLDPSSLEGRLLFAHAGAPMGGVSVAVPVTGGLALGSFAADRLALVPRSALYRLGSDSDGVVAMQ